MITTVHCFEGGLGGLKETKKGQTSPSTRLVIHSYFHCVTLASCSKRCNNACWSGANQKFRSPRIRKLYYNAKKATARYTCAPSSNFEKLSARGKFQEVVVAGPTCFLPFEAIFDALIRD